MNYHCPKCGYLGDAAEHEPPGLTGKCPHVAEQLKTAHERRVAHIVTSYRARLALIEKSPEHMRETQFLYADALLEVELALADFVEEHGLEDRKRGTYSAILGQLSVDLAMGMLAEEPTGEDQKRMTLLSQLAGRLYQSAVRKKLLPLVMTPLLDASGQPIKRH